ncbi:hypothetical protein BC567DRAFT_224755 [Phyllosticta citribraziliensis]
MGRQLDAHVCLVLVVLVAARGGSSRMNDSLNPGLHIGLCRLYRVFHDGVDLDRLLAREAGVVVRREGVAPAKVEVAKRRVWRGHCRSLVLERVGKDGRSRRQRFRFRGLDNRRKGRSHPGAAWPWCRLVRELNRSVNLNGFATRLAAGGWRGRWRGYIQHGKERIRSDFHIWLLIRGGLANALAGI